MAFLLYFFVLLVSAASVMFGLDLMTSPLPSTPNVPIGHTTQRMAQVPVQRLHSPARNRDEDERQVARAEDENVTERSLTPIYPASPGPSAPVQTTGTAPAEPVTVESERAEHSADTQAAGEPVEAAAAEVDSRSPHCNIDACRSAYRSFTVADCTYQPSQGARRLCEKSEAATVAATPLPEPAPVRRPVTADSPAKQKTVAYRKSRDELAEVERVVRRITPAGRPLALHPPSTAADAREMSEVERIVRKMTRGRYAGDIPVIDGSGRVIIVRTDASRAQAYR